MRDEATQGLYKLSRDGRELMVNTLAECWQYIHNTHSYSVDWACRHEGYSIEPVRADHA